LTHLAENLPETAYWLIEFDTDNEIHDAWAADGMQPRGLQVTQSRAIQRKDHTEKWHKGKRKDHSEKWHVEQAHRGHHGKKDKTRKERPTHSSDTRNTKAELKKHAFEGPNRSAHVSCS
jgi:hypothetical protein